MGAQPRQLALLIAADMAIPTLAGALLGSVIYAAVMSSLRTFTLVGNSYWASDLILPLGLALALPMVVVFVGLVSAIRMVYRAGRDPVGTLRRERKHTSYLAYMSSAGIVAGPAAMFAASEADFNLAPWLITAGLLLSVVGLEGLSRVAVAVAGRLLADWTRAQVAGWRMYQGGAEAVLGVSATAVAVFLVIFTVYSNFENRPPATGNFHLKAEFLDVISREQLVWTVAALDGVTRVVPVGETRGISIGEYEGGLYTMTCEDVPGSVKLEGPCLVGNIYPVRRLADADTVNVWIDPNRYPPGFDSSDSGTDVASDLSGTYPVGGRVTASWLPATSNFQAVLIVDELPATTTKTFLLITTDGEPSSLRRVIEGLEARPEETWVTTKWAIEAGIEVGRPNDELVIFPYLFVMAMTAAGMAAGRAALRHHAALPPATGGIQGAPLLWRDPDAAGRRPRAAVRGPADTRLRAGRRIRHHSCRELQRGVRRPRLARKPAGNSRPGLRPGDRHSRDRPRSGQSYPHSAARVRPRRHDVVVPFPFAYDN